MSEFADIVIFSLKMVKIKSGGMRLSARTGMGKLGLKPLKPKGLKLANFIGFFV
jgi:hypothetical protein